MDDNIVILKDDEIIYTNDRGVAYSFNQTDKSATITKNDNTIELPVSDRNGHLVVDANSNSISRRLTAMILLTQAYKDVSKFAEVEDERQI
jgi:hypothetical protein